MSGENLDSVNCSICYKKEDCNMPSHEKIPYEKVHDCTEFDCILKINLESCKKCDLINCRLKKEMEESITGVE